MSAVKGVGTLTGAGRVTPANIADGAEKSSEAKRTAEAAKQFEGIFVRQLLAAAKIMGPKGDQGYGGLAMESLADGVLRAGGLGLAQQIEDAMRPRQENPSVGAAAKKMTIEPSSAGESRRSGS